MSKVLYLSGPITGLPDLGVSAFNEAHLKLAEAGYKVLDPTHIGDPLGVDADKSWEWWMRRAMSMMLEAHGIATLDGWSRSKGARLEVYVGNTVGLEWKPVDGWLEEVANDCAA